MNLDFLVLIHCPLSQNESKVQDKTLCMEIEF